jgi:ATP-dependent RNA helicase RhlE
MSSESFGAALERPLAPTAPAAPVAPTTPATFESLGLAPELLRAVVAEGYTEPTPVQAESIPIVLAGRDLLAGAQTGTGKTAAFVLPILQLLNATRRAVRYIPAGKARRRGESGMPIRCLVLTPTRELALQIEESCRTYGKFAPILSTTIYGGVGFQPQVRNLKNGPEIVVATPGRLLDHAGQGTIDLSQVEILVLDEADRMLDMGFIRDIRRIMELLPATRQNLLFSATFSDEIRELASGLLHDPEYVQIARRNAAIELVRQVVYPVDRERKRELLSHLIRSGRIDRALVFTRTKHGANRLAEQLELDGVKATAIHGNKSQGQRVKALDDFKAGRASILVATELAARGLDIDGLPHVVNFELPMVAQDYVHRIGRTGRAGLEGDAVSLVCIDENILLSDIEKLLRQQIRREVVEGFEVNRAIPREPIRQRTMGLRQGEGRGGPARPPHRSASPVRSARPAPTTGFRPEPAQQFRQPAAPFRQPAAVAAPRPAPRPAYTEQRPAYTEQRPAAQAAPRQAAPNGMRQFPNAAPRPSYGTGFNTSTPVEPRRNGVGGFRRPVASDFSQPQGSAPARRPAQGGRQSAPGGYAAAQRSGQGAPRQAASSGQSIGYAPVRRPSGYSDGGPRQGYQSRPAQAPSNSGGRQGPRRPMPPLSQGERRDGQFIPGERISRGGREG